MLNLLNRELQLYRSSFVPNSTGGLVETRIFQRNLWVRVSQPSATELAMARISVGPQQGGAILTHQVYVDPDEDVRRNDELRDDDTGEVLRVFAVVEPSSGSFYRRLDCEDRQAQEEL